MGLLVLAEALVEGAPGRQEGSQAGRGRRRQQLHMATPSDRPCSRCRSRASGGGQVPPVPVKSLLVVRRSVKSLRRAGGGSQASRGSRVQPVAVKSLRRSVVRALASDLCVRIPAPGHRRSTWRDAAPLLADAAPTEGVDGQTASRAETALWRPRSQSHACSAETCSAFHDADRCPHRTTTPPEPLTEVLKVASDRRAGITPQDRHETTPPSHLFGPPTKHKSVPPCQPLPDYGGAGATCEHTTFQAMCSLWPAFGRISSGC